MTDNYQQRSEVVDIATNSLREVPVLDGPSPELVASTLEALHSSTPSPEPIRHPERKARMLLIARRGGLVAAGFTIAATLAWLAFTGTPSRVAFADVIRNVNEAKSVQMQVIQLERQGEEELRLTFNWYFQGDQFRMEVPAFIYDGDQVRMGPVQLVVVGDQARKQSVQFDQLEKTALRETLTKEASMQSNNFLHQLNHLRPEAAQLRGEEEIGGRPVLAYEFTDLSNVNFLGLENGEGLMKIWVDPISKLPVQIHVSVVTSGEFKDAEIPFDTTLKFEKFEWNKNFDPSLFSMEIPEDYTVSGE